MNLQKKNKWILIFILVLSVTLFSTYNYIYKSHKLTEELPTEFKGTSSDFINLAKNSDWVNKAVEIKGQITSKDSLGLILNNNIYCQLRQTKNIDKLTKSQTITIKGIVIGYDDLLDELKLNQCIIKN